MTSVQRPTNRRPAWRTVPNLVTAIRFALIAPIAALLLWAQPLGAAMLAAVFAAADWVDGHLARKLDQVSRAGARWPIAPVSDASRSRWRPRAPHRGG